LQLNIANNIILSNIANIAKLTKPEHIRDW